MAVAGSAVESRWEGCAQASAINGNAAQTYSNVCFAQVAQRTAMADKLGPLNIYAAAGACHP